PQPLQVSDELVFIPRLTALHIRVFTAQDVGPAMLSGKKPVKESGARIANVQLTSRRRRKSDTNFRGISHATMLAEKPNLFNHREHGEHRGETLIRRLLSPFSNNPCFDFDLPP
ncbi:MAG: hypothetical protein JWO20_2229, partial [Candidatus Angelobacter sp.]|nr:hypothetical protein [Candidatus Angelobacter sp.]